MLGEIFAERVAVVLLPELRENGESKAAAPEFESKVFEDVLRSGLMLCLVHCTSHTVSYTVYDVK